MKYVFALLTLTIACSSFAGDDEEPMTPNSHPHFDCVNKAGVTAKHAQTYSLPKTDANATGRDLPENCRRELAAYFKCWSESMADQGLKQGQMKCPPEFEPCGPAPKCNPTS